jgi:hypothetical protein
MGYIVESGASDWLLRGSTVLEVKDMERGEEQEVWHVQ